jgi:septation ring formation regulator EzrA
MDTHVEIKDKCDDLESRLNEIASDIRELPFKYKIVENYTIIDEELFHVYEWYEKNKEILKKYEKERKECIEILNKLNIQTKSLNNEVQNVKSQASSHVLREVSYSQLPYTQHL